MIGRGKGRRRYTSCSPSLPWSPLPLALSASGLDFLSYRIGQKNLDGDVSRSCFLHCRHCPSRHLKHRLSRFRKVVVHYGLLPQEIKYMGSLILTPNGYIWTHTLLCSGWWTTTSISQTRLWLRERWALGSQLVHVHYVLKISAKRDPLGNKRTPPHKKI